MYQMASKRRHAAVALSALLLVAAITGHRLNEGLGEKIIEGTEAAPGEFPFMVALYINASEGVKFHCGASLLSPYYAITAGHCVSGWYPERFTVVGGTVDLETQDATAVEVPVEEITVHDLFHFEVGTSIPTNDVALLKLGAGGLSGSAFGAVTIPEQDEEVPVDSICTVLGWGATEEGGPVESKLRKADVRVQNMTYCYESYGGLQFRPTMLCAGWPTGGADACQGDSGGPLLCSGRLQGLVSWGDGCGEPLKFGVYARLSVFADWIEKNNFVEGYPESEMIGRK